jgi:hypothetical protein
VLTISSGKRPRAWQWALVLALPVTSVLQVRTGVDMLSSEGVTELKTLQ